VSASALLPALARAAPRDGVAAAGPALSRSKLFHYAAPLLAIGFMTHMVSFYFLKYATDVLLIAPASVGLVFGAARIWDAVTDPPAGYWSDRTRTRFGRRRPWMLAAALPLALSYVALWSPPESLGEHTILLWTALALFALQTATTVFGMPHAALGAEISSDHHERTRVFTWAKVFEAGGGLLGLGVLALLVTNLPDQRRALASVSAGVGCACVALVAISVARLREPAAHQGRGAREGWRAVGDVWRNRHARPLLLAGTLGSLGGACAKLSVPYACHYLLGDLALMPALLGAFVLPFLLAQPIWLPLSRRFGKRAVWLAASAVQALGLGALFFGDQLPLAGLFACVAVAGAADGGTSVLGLSLKADVIDADELATGERKEGTYFAMWGLAMKTSFGLATVCVGWGLEAAGFEPGAVQSSTSLFGIRTLQGLVPCVFLSAAFLCMLRFRLDAAEHARIRRALDARRLEACGAAHG
jgi:GPH family glycoside/pentoside/hexuronide:cation symporter